MSQLEKAVAVRRIEAPHFVFFEAAKPCTYWGNGAHILTAGKCRCGAEFILAQIDPEATVPEQPKADEKPAWLRSEVAALGRAAYLCNEWGEMSARARFLRQLETLEKGGEVAPSGGVGSRSFGVVEGGRRG